MPIHCHFASPCLVGKTKIPLFLFITRLFFQLFLSALSNFCLGQLDRTGQELDQGLGVCCEVNDKLVASNYEARTLAEELGLCAASALATAAKGATRLGDGSLSLRLSAEEALRLNCEAASSGVGMCNVTLQVAQVGSYQRIMFKVFHPSPALFLFLHPRPVDAYSL